MEVRRLGKDDPDFPELLRETPWPPTALYIKGSYPGQLKNYDVAIVGTRKASERGKTIAKDLAFSLSKRGVDIVSGLAFGIDSAAHAGAIEADGKTFAVLANGLDEVYPKSNEGLATRILEGGGGLISEYEPGTPPLEYRFLERNRIIAGLVRGVVVIEAPKRSGALATARYAAEAGRDVYVLPGRAGDPNYAGSHALIREGAILIDSPEDLFEDLGIDIRPLKTEENDANTDIILSLLRSSPSPLGIDELIEATTLSSSEINRILAFLVIESKVAEDKGGYKIN